MTHTYATLAQIKRAINSTLTTEDATLLDYAAYVSERIDLIMQSDVPFFLPYQEARDVPVDPMRINSALNTLALDAPLLELSSVSINDGAISDAVAYPANASPIRVLRRTGTDCANWYGDCVAAGELPEISITGVWGFRRRGGTRWKQIGTLAADINASVTGITVNNLATVPAAISGESDSNFSAGCLFRIGSEYLTKSYSASGNTVERGVHGTTAAAHTTGAAVEVFQVEAPIARVTARQSGLLLSRRGAYDTRNSDGMGGSIIYPQDLLLELYAVMQGYVYE
jgi:hypothetical protein